MSYARKHTTICRVRSRWKALSQRIDHRLAPAIGKFPARFKQLPETVAALEAIRNPTNVLEASVQIHAPANFPEHITSVLNIVLDDLVEYQGPPARSCTDGQPVIMDFCDGRQAWERKGEFQELPPEDGLPSRHLVLRDEIGQGHVAPCRRRSARVPRVSIDDSRLPAHQDIIIQIGQHQSKLFRIPEVILIREGNPGGRIRYCRQYPLEISVEPKPVLMPHNNKAWVRNLGVQKFSQRLRVAIDRNQALEILVRLILYRKKLRSDKREVWLLRGHRNHTKGF